MRKLAWPFGWLPPSPIAHPERQSSTPDPELQMKYSTFLADAFDKRTVEPVEMMSSALPAPVFPSMLEIWEVGPLPHSSLVVDFVVTARAKLFPRSPLQVHV